MKNILYKLALKPGKRAAFRKYLKRFDSIRAECSASLKGEGTVTEHFFLDGDMVYIFKQVKSLAQVKRFQKSSRLSVYRLVREMDDVCFGAQKKLFSVLDFAPPRSSKKSAKTKRKTA